MGPVALGLAAGLATGLHADFDLDAFTYVPFWDAPMHRMDLRLRAEMPQHVTIPGADLSIDLASGEVTDLYTECAGNPLRAPNDLVFDIGSHVGDRIAAFRRLGARVMAEFDFPEPAEDWEETCRRGARAWRASAPSPSPRGAVRAILRPVPEKWRAPREGGNGSVPNCYGMPPDSDRSRH